MPIKTDDSQAAARQLFAGLESIPAPPEPDAVALYPDTAAPNGVEIWEAHHGERWVRNVRTPTLTPILPPPGAGTGAAVVVAPGSAFRALAWDNEGVAVGRWFAQRGIAAFIVKYRVLETPAASDAFSAVLGDLMVTVGAASAEELAVDPEALADGQQAVRLVRSSAEDWGVDPARVGFVGFSAGAITAVAMAVQSPPGARPDFVVAIYPSMLAVEVPADAPPLFVALASDDPLFGRQGFRLVESWQAAQRPVELHWFERGGHGFGMHRQDLPADRWITTPHGWTAMHGWVPPRSYGAAA